MLKMYNFMLKSYIFIWIKLFAISIYIYVLFAIYTHFLMPIY